jgi:hypothetical protein
VPEEQEYQPGENEWEIRPFETAGQKWRVFVSKNGYFTARHPIYGVVTGSSTDDAERKARAATSTGRVKVAVQYDRLNRNSKGWHVVHGVATGIHGSSGNVLYREGAETGQVSSGGDIMRPLSEMETAELVEVSDQADALAERRRELMKKYAIGAGYRGLSDVVRKAVEAKRAEEAGGE